MGDQSVPVAHQNPIAHRRLLAVAINKVLSFVNTTDRRNIGTLADSATPSVAGYRNFITGGTTTITDFTDGEEGQVIQILSEHAITITDGTNIFLSGSTNFVMANTDSLQLIQKADGNWYEVSRSVN